MGYLINYNQVSYTVDGVQLAVVDFPEKGNGLVDITRTFVDDSLRGQGIASEMLRLVAEHLIQTNRKTLTTCSYAKYWFQNHDEYLDLIAE